MFTYYSRGHHAAKVDKYLRMLPNALIAYSNSLLVKQPKKFHLAAARPVLLAQRRANRRCEEPIEKEIAKKVADARRRLRFGAGKDESN